MKIYTKCAKCRSEIVLKTNASDRFVLAKKIGETIDLSCKSCGTNKKYHVKEMKAEESKIVGFISLLIFLGGTSGIFFYLWPYFFRTSYIYAISALIGVLTVPFLIYQAINFGQSNKVKYFNAKQYG
ncbi:hypothetical protein [uncultured Cyclobacterium sp.]|uniref:hypothetical protein n=1 Tax=uncultured Cyclobacterium sp. TaxID=453820 RepID=UPI0030EF846B|tara:strand:+ start:119696 stop:120076 length:381 start_codon:yes stop_codon:yes gene_type:complete